MQVSLFMHLLLLQQIWVVYILKQFLAKKTEIHHKLFLKYVRKYDWTNLKIKIEMQIWNFLEIISKFQMSLDPHWVTAIP